MKAYLGIDPGASGGIAVVTDDADPPRYCPTPPTLGDIWRVLWGLEPGPAFAVIEKVGGYVAGNPTPGSAMFTFGKGYGALLMALVAAGIPFEEVTPQKWQKGLGIPPRKPTETKTQFKNRLKARAQELFPGEKITLATADALLIAEYARRTYQ